MPRIVPFFIMNRGCPNRCIFCNESLTAGDQPLVATGDDVARLLAGWAEGRPAGSGAGREDEVQVAFYGGNFTGLPLADQSALLRPVQPFIAEGLVQGIRISTRPDDIDPAHLDILKECHVRTVEIGAQSLVDAVLSASRRGHSADDVRRAVTVLRAEGFEVGLHLMIGLPGDNRARFSETVEAAVAMAPDMVRLHPTLVFRDTPLAEAFYRGDYTPLTMEEALAAGRDAKRRFQEARIPVIRLGLQTTREMEQPGAIVAGPFHPAFGALVDAAALLDQASGLLEGREWRDRWVTFLVPPRQESAFRGNRNGNLRILTERFQLAGIKIMPGEKFSIHRER